MDRGAPPSASSAPRTRNAAATPARDAWAKASATRDSLRSMLNTPTVPAATPSRIAAQSTTFVLKPPPKERARSHSATNSPMSVRPVRLARGRFGAAAAPWRGPRRPDPGPRRSGRARGRRRSAARRTRGRGGPRSPCGPPPRGDAARREHGLGHLVHARERLVEDDRVGVLCEGAREEPLLLTAGELADGPRPRARSCPRVRARPPRAAPPRGGRRATGRASRQPPRGASRRALRRPRAGPSPGSPSRRSRAGGRARRGRAPRRTGWPQKRTSPARLGRAEGGAQQRSTCRRRWGRRPAVMLCADRPAHVPEHGLVRAVGDREARHREGAPDSSRTIIARGPPAP